MHLPPGTRWVVSTRLPVLRKIISKVHPGFRQQFSAIGIENDRGNTLSR